MNTIDAAELSMIPGDDCLVIDTRAPELFAEGFIEGALSLPFDERLADRILDLEPDKRKVVIVAEDENAEKIMATVTAAGIKAYYLNGGFESWKKTGYRIDMLILIEADEFAMDYQFDEFYLVDLRSVEEHKAAYVEDAENLPLPELERVLPELDNDGSYYVYGATAQDAVTAASLFKHYGFQRVRPIAADFEAIKQTNIPMVVPKKKENPGGNFSHN